MPGSFRFEPCPNCCVTGCVYESDAFDRADSSSLGAKWTETAGDWSIASNSLAVSSASAKATCTTLHPTPTNKYIVSATVKFTTNGDVARVYVGDSAYYAELERITSSCGRMRLYDGATCKGSVGVSLSTWTRMVVCSEEDKVHVGTGGSPMLTVPATVTSSIVALGTAACAGTVSFEDFSLSKHYEDDNTCPSCGSEGCTWFSDNGCASGSLSATDWTTTGTWAYATYTTPCIRCSANGTLTTVPTHPLASGKTKVVWEFDNDGFWWTSSQTGVAQFSLGGGAYVEVKLDSTLYYITATLWKSGVAYGRVSQRINGSSYWLNKVTMCWDGTTVTASVQWYQSVYPFNAESLGGVADTIATVAAGVTMATIRAGSTFHITSVTATKSPDDVSGCAWCDAVPCSHCSAGTFANHATVTIAAITSIDYYCVCTDQTIDLYATSSGCQWTGTKTGPCSSGTWTATATITATGGGYKLTVVVTTSSGSTATFEDTVVSGSPVDCLTAFDGDIPWVSASGSLHCTLGSATCTFATP